MDNIKGATARLRHTFQYPTDDSSTDPDTQEEVLDEDEQDNLIQALAAQNAARNEQFRNLLLAVPLLATIPFLLGLVRWSHAFLPALLAFSSLLSTAWLLRSLPPDRTGIKVLDDWPALWGRSRGSGSGTAARGSSSPTAASASSQRRRGRSSSFSYALDPSGGRSPMEAHLPWLNGVLCAVLAASGLLGGGGSSTGFGALELCLPATVYAAVLAAKVIMAGVNPEQELEGLRYEYKGA